MTALIRLLVLLILGLGLAAQAQAHEVRPGALELTEHGDGRLDAVWKRPVSGEAALRLVPHISSGLLDGPPATVQAADGFIIQTWRGLAPAEPGIAGQTVTVNGLAGSITDVFVTVTTAQGLSRHLLLTPAAPSASLAPGVSGVAGYFTLGVMHILTGPDHLMFVLGLMLLVAGRRALLAAISAFTLAHSLTLAATALELVRVRPALVEALVALSVACLAAEVVQARRGRGGLAARLPWAIAFTFGLLHGFAFAGALAELGLPRSHIATALLLFNLGVEAGQLLFVGAVLLALALLQRLPWRLPGWLQWIPPYAIGVSATFWFIERVALLL
jgi:hydrogenase/urease accessory protein HupE